MVIVKMAAENENIAVSTPPVLPDGNGGFMPCPKLLTEAEAVLYLRLDTLGRKDPTKTLQYYREKHLLHATRIGNVNFYMRESLDEFLATMTNLTYERSRK